MFEMLSKDLLRDKEKEKRKKNFLSYETTLWPCFSGTFQKVSFPVSAEHDIFQGAFLDLFLVSFSAGEQVRGGGSKP